MGLCLRARHCATVRFLLPGDRHRNGYRSAQRDELIGFETLQYLCFHFHDTASRTDTQLHRMAERQVYLYSSDQTATCCEVTNEKRIAVEKRGTYATFRE